MLQKEFFERTNIQLSDAEYNKVDAMYCDAGNLDKDQFCQDYKKHHDSILIQEFYNKSVSLKSSLDKSNAKISDLAMFLVDQTEKCSSSDLRDKAIELLGIEKYLSVKIQKGYNIWDIDKDDLIKILNNK
jgi:hypothetical protein